MEGIKNVQKLKIDLHSYCASGISGLVVKSNVAIVGPRVRFSANAHLSVVRTNRFVRAILQYSTFCTSTHVIDK